VSPYNARSNAEGYAVDVILIQDVRLVSMDLEKGGNLDARSWS